MPLTLGPTPAAPATPTAPTPAGPAMPRPRRRRGLGTLMQPGGGATLGVPSTPGLGQPAARPAPTAAPRFSPPVPDRYNRMTGGRLGAGAGGTPPPVLPPSGTPPTPPLGAGAGGTPPPVLPPTGGGGITLGPNIPVLPDTGTRLDNPFGPGGDRYNPDGGQDVRSSVDDFRSWAQTTFGRPITDAELEQIARATGIQPGPDGRYSMDDYRRAQEYAQRWARDGNPPDDGGGPIDPGDGGTDPNDPIRPGGGGDRNPIDVPIEDAPGFDAPDLEQADEFDDPTIDLPDAYQAPTPDMPADYAGHRVNLPDAYRGGRIDLPENYRSGRIDLPPEYTPQNDFGYDRYNAAPAFQAPTATDAASDAGYQFRLREGMRALTNNAAARRAMGSTNTLGDFMRYGQDMASQEYENVYNRRFGEHQDAAANRRADFQVGYGAEADTYDRNTRNRETTDDRRFRNATTQFDADRAADTDEYDRASDASRTRFEADRQAGLDEYGSEVDLASRRFDADRLVDTDEYDRADDAARFRYGAAREGATDAYDRGVDRGQRLYDTTYQARTDRYNRGRDRGLDQFEAQMRSRDAEYQPQFATWQARQDRRGRDAELNFDRGWQQEIYGRDEQRLYDFYNADDAWRRDSYNADDDRARDFWEGEDLRARDFYSGDDRWRRDVLEEERLRYLTDRGVY